jgi:hypothetical protein
MGSALDLEAAMTMICVAVDQVDAKTFADRMVHIICVARLCSMLVQEKLSEGHPDDRRTRKR